MNENIFRILAALILLTGMGISSYFRIKADKQTGEKISRKVDGSVMMNIIKFGGLILWLSPFVYLINPQWMAWAKIGLPEWVRVLGIGVAIVNDVLLYWLFSSIGSGISPTSATRKEHKLSTSGPYRWVRHPLYTVGAILFISFGMMADNWFIAALGILAFIAMAKRTPQEEANLVEKFGDEYREYMKRTGRFFPKVGSR
ncbi:isoprenylcysteine carboxylmethyltransferase family protein [Candidatus Villigracilis affinis]|uniref:isoprenylcysteine carboxylmethyltransferase family protein n=1 Tax=Candidatus Villigracilis affinis TaxID=3140682 RepID=UPI002A232402|nr:isoprenylcysteine carboxylmethyltransferase family protein [Anaerolineales bacterium]